MPPSAQVQRERILVACVTIVYFFCITVDIDYQFFHILFFHHHHHLELHSSRSFHWQEASSLLQFAFWLFLIFVIGWCYLKLLLVDPGRVPSMFSFAAAAAKEEGGGGPPLKPLRFVSTKRTCMICAMYKPQRAHHCTPCGRCVLKYDHHCPWIANCVGFHNHKFYFLLLAYLWIYSALVLLTVGVPMTLAVFQEAKTHPGDSFLMLLSMQRVTHHIGFSVFILLLLAFFAFIFTSFLLPKHKRYLLENKTSLEVVLHGTEYFQSQFSSLRGWKGNVAAVFGDNQSWYRYILPLSPHPHGGAEVDDCGGSRGVPAAVSISSPASQASLMGRDGKMRMANYGTTTVASSSDSYNTTEERYYAALLPWLEARGAAFQSHGMSPTDEIELSPHL